MMQNKEKGEFREWDIMETYFFDIILHYFVMALYKNCLQVADRSDGMEKVLGKCDKGPCVPGIRQSVGFMS